MRKEIAATFDPVIRAAHESHRAALAAKKSHDEPLDKVEGYLRRALGEYQFDQEKALRIKQAELEAAQRHVEEAARLEEAIALEKAGKISEAKALLEQPLVMAPVVAPDPTPKVDGLSYRETWKAQGENLYALISAIQLKNAPLQCVTFNDAFLNAQARALKADFNVPGVKVWCEKTVVQR